MIDEILIRAATDGTLASPSAREALSAFMDATAVPRADAVMSLMDAASHHSAVAAAALGEALLQAIRAEESDPAAVAAALQHLAECQLKAGDPKRAMKHAETAGKLLLVPEFRQTALRVAVWATHEAARAAAKGKTPRPTPPKLVEAQRELEAAGRPSPTTHLRPKGGLSFAIGDGGSKAWIPVTVHFATDRIPQDHKNPGRVYGASAIGKVLYGKAEVQVLEDVELSEIRRAIKDGDLSITRLARAKGSPAELISVEDLDEEKFLRAMRDATSGPNAEALVFVHGFATGFGKSLKVAAQLSAALDVRGPTIAYSWPSQGAKTPWDYNADERMAADLAGDDLASVLLNVLQATGTARVLVIAHSMGNRLVLAALNSLSSSGARRIHHVVFAAPDVPQSQFKTLAAGASDVSNRATLYSSEKDFALTMAPYFSELPERRAGCGTPPVIVERIDTIDTTHANGDPIGHSDFSGTARDDVRALVWHDTMPAFRDLIEQVDIAEGSYYRFRPLRDVELYLDNCRRAILLARIMGYDGAIGELDRRINRLLIDFKKTRLELLDIRRFVTRICGSDASEPDRLAS